MGLNLEYYSPLRTQILSMDPLSSLDRTYKLAIQDEQVRLATTDPPPPTDVLGFAVRGDTTRGRGSGFGERPFCTNYNKVGHDLAPCWQLLTCSHYKKHEYDIKTCLKLVGYPDNWPNNSCGSGRGSRSPAAGGRARDLPKANAVAAVGAPALSPTPAAFTLFSADQWKAISGLLGNVKLPEERLNGMFVSSSWSIDIGAYPCDR